LLRGTYRRRSPDLIFTAPEMRKCVLEQIIVRFLLIHGNSFNPHLFTKPCSLSFGILAGGEVDEFLASLSGDFSSEV
jgi:hypothetical protein